MPGLPLTWLDVFTDGDRPLTGNGLPVVHDADGLDDAALQAFAVETRQSETTFVQRATVDGADYRNRIFMTTGELPFAGHPTLGTAVAVAYVRGESEADYVQQTPAGLQPIHVTREGRVAEASMLQEPAVLGDELDAGEVLAVAGLTAADAAPGGLPPQVVSTGVAQVIAPVRASALARVRVPDVERLRALVEPRGAVCLYVIAWEPGAGRARARSFFVDRSGATEDPATGSAAGPLLAYLFARKGLQALDVFQGAEIGRPSHLVCTIDDRAERVRVGGRVVVVGEGEVHLA